MARRSRAFHGLHLTRARSNTLAFDALAVEVLALEVLDAALPRGVEHGRTDQPADFSTAALPDGFFFDAPFLAIA